MKGGKISGWVGLILAILAGVILLSSSPEGFEDQSSSRLGDVAHVEVFTEVPLDVSQGVAPQAPYGWEPGQESWGAQKPQVSVVTFTGGDAYFKNFGSGFEWRAFENSTSTWIPVDDGTVWTGFWREFGRGKYRLQLFKVHSGAWQTWVEVGTEVHFCGPSQCYASVVVQIPDPVKATDESKAVAICGMDAVLVTCLGDPPTHRTLYCLENLPVEKEGYVSKPPSWGGL